MKGLIPAIVLCMAASLAAPVSAGDVKVQVANGRITLQARDATLREILAEWGRVGQVQMINLDKVSGPPMTIEVQEMPESQALGMLLRTLSGYMAAPKAQAAGNTSVFDRVVIMAAPRPAPAAAPASYAQTPGQQIFRGGVQPMPGTDDQDPTSALPPGFQTAPVRGIQFQQPPMAQPGITQMPATPFIPQGAPGTVSPIPGLMGTAPTSTGAPGTVSPLPTIPQNPPGTQGGTGRQTGPGRGGFSSRR